MKKIFAVFLGVLLTVSLIAITGCGEDTSKAQEYLEAGDLLFYDAWESAIEAEEVYLTLYEALWTDDTAILEEIDFTEATEDAEKALSGFEGAKEEYEKILQLNSYEDHKAYAQKMTECCNTNSILAQDSKELIYLQLSSASTAEMITRSREMISKEKEQKEQKQKMVEELIRRKQENAEAQQKYVEAQRLKAQKIGEDLRR
jgi:hypothetical protein